MGIYLLWCKIQKKTLAIKGEVDKEYSNLVQRNRSLSHKKSIDILWCHLDVG